MSRRKIPNTTHLLLVKYRHPLWTVVIETETVRMSESAPSLQGLADILYKAVSLIEAEEKKNYAPSA